MEWWQIILLIVGSIVVGILVAILVIYLIELFAGRRDFLIYLNQRFAKKREVTPDAEGQPISLASDLVAEVTNNHGIATGPRTDKLLPFQTQVWDARQYEVNKLPEYVRQDLEQAYVDMRLANSIVWLSNEFSRTTPNLSENYTRLCNSIAERLDRVKPLIEQSVK